MAMKIYVTWEHIREGKDNRGCAMTCPIAWAMRDAGCVDPVVSDRHVEWGADAFERGHLPTDAQVFIRNFDDGQPVEPFSFEIYES